MIIEASRKVKIAGEYQVIVCGGGPAGVAAAVSSARVGARTLLIEANGCLGGVWTSGLLCWVIDAKNKNGFMAEVIKELDNISARPITSTDDFSYDCEAMKWILEKKCTECGVDVLYHTRVVSAVMDSENCCQGVITESKSQRQYWKAKNSIDCTGDGDLCHLAGCSFHVGEPNSGQVQPMSLLAVVTGIDLQKVSNFVHNYIADATLSKKNFLRELEKAGVHPSYQMPTLSWLGGQLFAFSINHQYNILPFDSFAVTKATINARDEIFKSVCALKKLGGIWNDIQLVSTGEHIGVREGRRVVGLYTVTVDDIISGKVHDDAICRVSFCVDIHSPKGYGDGGVSVKPYDIPLRALIPDKVNGLMMAGRCISGDFFAHASYRVTGNAVVTGEWAGITSALSSLRSIRPSEVPWVAAAEYAAKE